MKKPECKVDEFWNKRWYLNGELHREGGPAVECLIRLWNSLTVKRPVYSVETLAGLIRFNSVGRGIGRAMVRQQVRCKMSKSKHTPGPWIVSDERTQNGAAIKCIRRADGKSAYNIAIIGDRMPSPSQWGPNARLIAAAPDAIQALESFQHAFRDFVRENPGINTGAFSQALYLAGYVITKATGGAK